MGTGRYSLMKKAHSCALLVLHLAGIDLPECPLASNQQVKYSRRKMEEAFAGISGVHIDMIITAKSNQEHDHILTQVLERAKDCNIMFNLHKLQLYE